MTWRRFVALLTSVLALILVALVIAYLWLIPRRGAGIVATEGAASDKQWTFLFAVYGPGTGAKKWFARPQGVATDGRRVYVTDTDNHRVVVMDDAGHAIRIVGSFGLRRVRFTTNPDWKPGQLAWPTDCAARSDGTIWVADTVNGLIQRFDPAGNATVVIPQGVRQEDFEPGAAGHATLLMKPLSPAVVQNRLYVSDGFRVSRYHLDGKPDGYLGKRQAGLEPGAFAQAWGVVADEAGSVAAADPLNHRVQAFSADGDLLWVAANPGASSAATTGAASGGEEVFALPRGMDRDAAGHIFVADALRSRVIALAASGRKLAELGETGRARGSLFLPNDVALTRSGRLFVCDKGNNRIQAFRLNIRLPE